jgi:hypothetical protein
LLVADEFVAAVVLIVRPPRTRRQDVAELDSAGPIKVMLAPVPIDARVDVVLTELLTAAVEEIVAVENVFGRAVRQRIGFQKGL